MRKSVEDLISGSGEVIGNSINQAISLASGSSGKSQPSPSPTPIRRCPSPVNAPTSSEKATQPSISGTNGRREISKSDTLLNVLYAPDKYESAAEETFNKSSESSKQINEISKSASTTNATGFANSSTDIERPKSVSKVSERAKKKAWYSVLYPSYKSRSEDFKKLFKDVPDDERLVVDYSCAIQRDILVHGRLYVSQNYICFYANIFRWETCLSVKWKDVTSVTKEKTARVIPNAILVCTQNERHFFTSFTTRDKAYLMLFRVWQNALMGKQMQPQEMWQWVHNCYGDELGLTSDDEDYIDPYEGRDEKIEILHNIPKTQLSTKSADIISDEKQQQDLVDTQIETANISLQQHEHTAEDSSSTAETTESKSQLSATTSTKPNRNNRHSSAAASQQYQDQLPTDMSDSSDSERNKISFVNTAECDSMHEGRQLIHTILPISVENLFSLIFSKSKFLVELQKSRKTQDCTYGEWTVDEEGKKVRNTKMTVTLTQSVGPKSAVVSEYQVMRECSKVGELYSIDIIVTNSGIPYADSFNVLQHFCMSRTVDDHTVFSVHAQITYKKSVWGVVKGFIDKNTWAGLEEYYTALVRALQSEFCIPPAKAKARRPRRGANTQQRAPVEEPRATIKPISVLPASPTVKLKEPSVVERKSNYETLSWFVIFLLFSLLFINIILYIKLWYLEDRTFNVEKFTFTELKDPPKSHDEWLHILQQQEALHATEMIKWQKVLQAAIELLKKVSIVCERILANSTSLPIVMKSSNVVHNIKDEL